MPLPVSITEERALTLEEAGVLSRAVAKAVQDAWQLLYGVDLGGAVGGVHPDVGTLLENGMPGAAMNCWGFTDQNKPTARFTVTISSTPVQNTD